jgi:hypothetical protein
LRNQPIGAHSRSGFNAVLAGDPVALAIAALGMTPEVMLSKYSTPVEIDFLRYAAFPDRLLG